MQENCRPRPGYRGFGAIVMVLLIAACGGGGSNVADPGGAADAGGSGNGAAAGGVGAGGGGGAAAGGGGGGAGGGAGGGGGAGVVGIVTSLEVVPASATVAVGGSARYSVVARDAGGLPVAAPILVWTSDPPAVGTIDADGLATGAGVGVASIVASSGGVTSAPAAFNVVESGPCDGIASVEQWDATVFMSYSDLLITSTGVSTDVSYSADVASALKPIGTVAGKLVWTGELVGRDFPGIPPGHNMSLLEQFDDHVSDPTTVIAVRGDGNPVPTAGVDGMRLEVDPATCTFQFYVAPSVHVTLTQTEHAVLTLPGPNEGTHVYSQDLPQGIIQRGVTPLGPWRAFGIGDYSDRILLFPSYSIGAIPPSLDAFVPSGVFPQIAFFDPLNPARHIGGDGTTRVDYHIRAHGP